MPSLEMAHYSATKTMQLSLSRSLAELTQGTNVTVNTVMPGSTLTEGVETMLNSLYPNESMTMDEAEKRFMKENLADLHYPKAYSTGRNCTSCRLFKQPAFFCNQWFRVANRWRISAQRVLINHMEAI